ncbi:MAG: glycosyltransferase, partial [Eubacteriales bacterium]
LTKKHEIILVDDGSTDNSYAKMCTLHSFDSRVKIIRLKKNYGQQNAIMCGLHYALGDFIVIMDDDIQNPPEEIENLFLKIIEGYDLVYGIPDRKYYNFYRFLGSQMRDFLFNIMLNKPKSIKVSSFRIMSRNLAQEIIKDKTSFVYISAITFKKKVKVANISVAHAKREYGGSNYSFVKLIKLFLNIFVNYSPLLSGFADKLHPQFEIADIKQ